MEWIVKLFWSMTCYARKRTQPVWYYFWTLFDLSSLVLRFKSQNKKNCSYYTNANGEKLWERNNKKVDEKEWRDQMSLQDPNVQEVLRSESRGDSLRSPRRSQALRKLMLLQYIDRNQIFIPLLVILTFWRFQQFSYT